MIFSYMSFVLWFLVLRTLSGDAVYTVISLAEDGQPSRSKHNGDGVDQSASFCINGLPDTFSTSHR